MKWYLLRLTYFKPSDYHREQLLELVETILIHSLKKEMYIFTFLLTYL